MSGHYLRERAGQGPVNTDTRVEDSLEDCDIAIASPPGALDTSPPFRFVLLSQAETKHRDIASQIYQLYRLNGGSNVAIVFLVDESTGKGATQSFMKLQVGLSHSLCPSTLQT